MVEQIVENPLNFLVKGLAQLLPNIANSIRGDPGAMAFMAMLLLCVVLYIIHRLVKK